LIGLLAFVLSGQYMEHFLAHLQGMPDGPRLLYRSAHIYLLWASLLNLALGSYVSVASHPGWRQIQALASALVLLAPVFVGISFFTESANAELVRPWARYGIYAAAAGCVLHTLVAFLPRRRRES
jgi:hypothetical protein